MHNYNNPFPDDSKKTLLWRVYLKTIVRNILNTKISINRSIKKCIDSTIPFPSDPEKYCYREGM